MAHLQSYVLNRMAEFENPTVRFNDSEQQRIARGVIWALCYPSNHDKLRGLEKEREEKFSVGERPMKTYPTESTYPPELAEFSGWVNDWIESKGV